MALLPKDILNELWAGIDGLADRQNEHLSGSGCPGFLHRGSLRESIEAFMVTNERRLTFSDVSQIVEWATGGACSVPMSAMARSVFEVCVLVQAAYRKDWDLAVDAKSRATFGEEWYAKNHLEVAT